MVGMRSTYRTKMEIIIAGRFSSCGAPRRDFFVNLWQIQSKSIAEIISSYFSVGSISYNSWMPNKLGCCIMVIEIGRASCRERVYIYVEIQALKEKMTLNRIYH